ncbi:hypothetical protein DSO57_1031109 [Entomophthora muscae]|uniref:Uncharacterized protein n=1 Tax=Entomophthora muscae TaxID=34485 RepID=A0ACC2S2V2_9FUNG|nr:hypothetical protein DSO57_1031109 [Entomophthora muscae]
MSVSPKSPTQGLDPEKYLKVHSPPSHFQQCKDDIDKFLEFWSQIPDRKNRFSDSKLPIFNNRSTSRDTANLFYLLELSFKELYLLVFKIL